MTVGQCNPWSHGERSEATSTIDESGRFVTQDGVESNIDQCEL